MERLLYRINEAAQMCGVSENTIRREVGYGNLPSVRVGRSLRFHKQDIDSFIQSKKIEKVKDERSDVKALAGRILKEVG